MDHKTCEVVTSFLVSFHLERHEETGIFHSFTNEQTGTVEIKNKNFLSIFSVFSHHPSCLCVCHKGCDLYLKLHKLSHIIIGLVPLRKALGNLHALLDKDVF